MNQRVRVFIKWVLRISLGVVGVAVAYIALTPTGHYLLRAAWEEGKILWNREPITEVLAEGAVDSVSRRKLSLVLEARQFAADSLGLDAGESFTTYSKLDRDTLVLVLSGAYKDRLKRKTWWFPVVGRVPYKGYFDFPEATRAERDLVRRGFDTNLRPASAFSTLGWFNDPLLSTTLKADSLELVNTVIHELLHNTFYAPGEAVFNESFANFVGARGAAAFFRSRGAERAAREVEARWGDDKLMALFWGRLYARMDSAFTAHEGEEASAVRARLAARAQIYGEARRELTFDLGPRFRTISPRRLERMRLDNGVLLARRVYLTDVELFDAVWGREGRDVRRAIPRVIALAKSDEDAPYDAIRRHLGLPVSADSVRGQE